MSVWGLNCPTIEQDWGTWFYMAGMQVISGKKPRKAPRLRVSLSHKLSEKKNCRAKRTALHHSSGSVPSIEANAHSRGFNSQGCWGKLNFPGQWRVPLWKPSLPSVCLLHWSRGNVPPLPNSQTAVFLECFAIYTAAQIILKICVLFRGCGIGQYLRLLEPEVPPAKVGGTVALW